jgi:hypothetical protein
VLRGDDRDQHSPADEVQTDDEARHAKNGSPFLTTQPAAEPGGRVLL